MIHEKGYKDTDKSKIVHGNCSHGVGPGMKAVVLTLYSVSKSHGVGSSMKAYTKKTVAYFVLTQLIMKACQDPDADTGAEQCTQTVMTQHIIGIMLQSDYVIRWKLHESYQCMGSHMTPHRGITPSPRPHHMDPHQENGWIVRQ